MAYKQHTISDLDTCSIRVNLGLNNYKLPGRSIQILKGLPHVPTTVVLIKLQPDPLKLHSTTLMQEGHRRK